MELKPTRQDNRHANSRSTLHLSTSMRIHELGLKMTDGRADNAIAVMVTTHPVAGYATSNEDADKAMLLALQAQTDV